MEFKNGQAIYIQIADYICESILSRKWKSGDRVPSIRELSVSVEVNPNTVMRTYSFLQDKGIIFNERGIGYFVGEGSYTNVLDLKKNEFYKTELPRLFNMMDLLGISLDDLNNKYKGYTENKRKGENNI
jgi:GntR family transcriptional regulator